MRALLVLALALASTIATAPRAEARPTQSRSAKAKAKRAKAAKAAKAAKLRRAKAAKAKKARARRLAALRKKKRGAKAEPEVVATSPVETRVSTEIDPKELRPTVVAAHLAALEEQQPWEDYFTLPLPNPRDPNAPPLPTDGTVTDEVVATLPDGTPLYRRRTKAARRKQDINIDGVPDEAAWKTAPVAVMDWQQKPVENGRAIGPTSFRILYDDDAIYVAADMFDPEPTKINALLWRMVGFRRVEQSDFIIAIISPSDDRSIGYAFGLTPAGVKGDYRVTRASGPDETYNAIWDGEVKRNPSGWTAEYRIPYSQMRVTDTKRPWGFQLYRKVARTVERDFWSPYPTTMKQDVLGMGEVAFPDPVRAGRAIELLPYALGGVRLERIGDSDTLHDPADPQYSVGADLKLALTSSLKLTASANPDFGQIEADPSEVNLTDRETFFSERRPLFIEDADLYQFRVGAGSENLFYSRRIGARPHFSQSSMAQYVEESDATTIYGAAKLSGTLGGMKLGLLSAVAAEEMSRAQLPTGEVQEAVVEPMTSYNVLQLGRSFRGGASDFRAAATGVHRFLDGTMIDRLHENAYAGAMQYTHQFANNQYSVSAMGGGSRVEGDTAALQVTQRASQRYFQRPDADHVELDPMATSLNGYAFGASAGKIAGTWRGSLAVDGRSPGFETNDVGFLLDADLIASSANIAYESLSKSGPTKSVLVSLTGQTVTDFAPELLRTGAQLDLESRLRSDWLVGGAFIYTHQILDTKLLRGGPAVRGVDSGEIRTYAESNPNKNVTVRLDAGVFAKPASNSWRASGGIGFTWDIRPNLEFNITPSVVINREDSQYVGAAADGMMTPHFVLGRIEQQTLIARTRLNYTITPRMSLQAYAEPFLSAGDFTSFKEAADVRANAYVDRFTEFDPSRVVEAMGQLQIDADGDGAVDFAVRRPDFQIGTLLTNFVFRWDFRPGSAAYLIWSQSREGSESDGVIDGGDLGDIFRSHSAHVVLVKLSWWANL